jgi:hypothetical protein
MMYVCILKRAGAHVFSPFFMCALCSRQVNVTFGVRSIEYLADTGFFLNKQHVKVHAVSQRSWWIIFLLTPFSHLEPLFPLMLTLNTTLLLMLNVYTTFTPPPLSPFVPLGLSRSRKVRGFCNHNSFASVGIALPERVQLYRVQSLRSVGGNGWRMSHNPPAPVLLDLLDAVCVEHLSSVYNF